MKRRKIIAKVLDPGQCRHYRSGQEFVLSGFTPKGLCDSAYSVLSRDAQTLAYGGSLPWQKEGSVLARCPDPVGAIWELRLADPPCGLQDGSAGASACPNQSWEDGTFVVETCKGKEGGCPSALAELQTLKSEIESAIERSGWNEFLRKRATGPLLPHQRLRVALAACPNACSHPQIRDIGLIASVRPMRVSKLCTGCGHCAEVCREKAIVMANDMPEFDGGRCLGCGKCGKACPAGALEMGDLRFRLLIGGRMGRRPCLASELPTLFSATDAAHAVGRALAELMGNAQGDESLSVVAAGIGANRMMEAIQGCIGGMAK
ncbi:MAG: TIGR04076 family protein [Planctomycetes bacterium]|nr:TIGR04076 family protein [Planctomycetota bacterium]